MNNLGKIESLILIRRRCTQNEFNGDEVRPSDVPNAEESKRFWGDIWSVEKEYNREAEWLKDIKIEPENDKHLQKRVVISIEKVTK